MNMSPTTPFPPDLSLPVQCGFKHRLPDGRVMDLMLRRVKEGNDTPVELSHDGPHHVSGYGRFSDITTLFERFEDEALKQADIGWARQAMMQLLTQAAEVCRYQPALWQLFTPKGKLELYAPEARSFDAQYISSNYTFKCHANALASHHQLLLEGLAQHLDYPFGPGERRFSTSRLFDFCFSTEKAIAPGGLAATIDDRLEKSDKLQAERQAEPTLEHVKSLLEEHSAAIRNSYERVLQRERFKALICAWCSQDYRTIDAPILQHFLPYIELDLAVHAQHAFQSYPTKTRDELADAMHIPLAMIFTAGNDDKRLKTHFS